MTFTTPGSVEKRLIKAVFLISIPVLLGTILVAHITQKTEPYPALLLPAGGGTVLDDDGVITTDRYELVARTANGQSHSIDPNHLLATVPFQYRFWVITNNFGLPDRSETGPPSSVELVARSWIHDRLEAQLGPDSFTAIEVREYEVDRPTRADRESDRRLVKVTTLPLS